jgi:hypothetical protein
MVKYIEFIAKELTEERLFDHCCLLRSVHRVSKELISFTRSFDRHNLLIMQARQLVILGKTVMEKSLSLSHTHTHTHTRPFTSKQADPF